MVINVKKGKDVITLDLRLNQIRYCQNVAQQGKISFLSLDDVTMACYKILFDEDKAKFKECLAEDLQNYTGRKFKPAQLEVMNG